MTEQIGRNKRPTIALFLDVIEGDFANVLRSGVVDGAELYDVNLILLPGRTLNTPFPYQYQHHVIYNLVNQDNIDAIILPAIAFSNYSTPEERERFYRSFAPIPIVTLFLAIPMAGASSIVCDGRPGLRELFEHLIVNHGKRRIAFIKGPDKNPEAIERFEIYCDMLKKYGLVFDKDLVCPGDFIEQSGVEAIKTLLDKRKSVFDALVASNDQMALGALSQLQKRGYRIPEDIAVAGFDNIEAARFNTLPLSTVEQPIYEMGKQAVALALARIRGEAPVTITMDSAAIFRGSCGCATDMIFERERDETDGLQPDLPSSWELVAKELEQIKRLSLPENSFMGLINSIAGEIDGVSTRQAFAAFDDILRNVCLGEDEVSYIHSLLSRLRGFRRGGAPDNAGVQEWEGFFYQTGAMLLDAYQRRNEERWNKHYQNLRTLRDVLSEMVSNLGDNETTVQSITKSLSTLGINSCFIAFYEKELVHHRGQPWIMPPFLQMALIFRDGQIEQVHQKNRSVQTRDFLGSSYISRDKRMMLVVSPLFFLENQLGLIVCEFNPNDTVMYDSLFAEMGCILKLSALIKVKEEIENKLRDAVKELEVYNDHLNNLSQTDELTGLYNRRGFLILTKQSLHLARQMSKSGLLFFADLDGLKMINDTYGHEEGDNAIRQTGMMLRSTFRNADIIARLGGDEFTVFTVDTTIEIARVIQNRLNQTMDEYNQSSGKPYQISISMGAVEFFAWDQVSIDELLAKADSLLYDQKRAKKLRRAEQA